MQEDPRKRERVINPLLGGWRNQAGFSQDEIARQRKLTDCTIQALEEEDPDNKVIVRPGPRCRVVCRTGQSL